MPTHHHVRQPLESRDHGGANRAPRTPHWGPPAGGVGFLDPARPLGLHSPHYVWRVTLVYNCHRKPGGRLHFEELQVGFPPRCSTLNDRVDRDRPKVTLTFVYTIRLCQNRSCQGQDGEGSLKRFSGTPHTPPWKSTHPSPPTSQHNCFSFPWVGFFYHSFWQSKNNPSLSKKAGLPEIIIIRLVIVLVISWAKQELMSWALPAPSRGLSAPLSWLFFLPWLVRAHVHLSLLGLSAPGRLRLPLVRSLPSQPSPARSPGRCSSVRLQVIQKSRRLRGSLPKLNFMNYSLLKGGPGEWGGKISRVRWLLFCFWFCLSGVFQGWPRGCTGGAPSVLPSPGLERWSGGRPGGNESLIVPTPRWGGDRDTVSDTEGKLSWGLDIHLFMHSFIQWLLIRHLRWTPCQAERAQHWSPHPWEWGRQTMNKESKPCTAKWFQAPPRKLKRPRGGGWG